MNRIKTITQTLLLGSIGLVLLFITLTYGQNQKLAYADAGSGAPNNLTTPPTVDGRFYDENGDLIDSYSLLFQDPALASVYGYLAGNDFYLAIIEAPALNDNVIDAEGSTSAYASSVGWTLGRGSRKLRDSEAVLDISMTCGATTFTWSQTYMCALGDMNIPSGHRQGNDLKGPLSALIAGGATFEPDGLGSWFSCNNDNGTPPPSYNAATSLVWNYENTTWEPDQTPLNPIPGANDSQWKSPFGSGNTPNDLNYPYFDNTNQWEWSMVYEMSFDISSCNGAPIQFTFNEFHNSPPKNTPPPPPHVITPTMFMDLGDLPAPYPTKLTDNGASHNIVPGAPILGLLEDAELDGTPHEIAIGDDFEDGDGDDEDGVVAVPGKNGAGWTIGTVATDKGGAFELTISQAAGVPAVFIDFNADGVLEDVPLLDAVGAPIATPFIGTITAYFDIPGDASLGEAWYTRVRVTSDGTDGNLTFAPLSASGPATNGEVEDYLFGLAPTNLTLTETNLNENVVSANLFSLALVLMASLLVATYVAIRQLPRQK